jgi:hypothetical protein
MCVWEIHAAGGVIATMKIDIISIVQYPLQKTGV